jgi:hypothetical protein
MHAAELSLRLRMPRVPLVEGPAGGLLEDGAVIECGEGLVEDGLLQWPGGDPLLVAASSPVTLTGEARVVAVRPAAAV